MTNKILFFLVLAVSANSAFAGDYVTLREDPMIRVTNCSSEDSSMVVDYQTGAYGLDPETTRVYATFNGAPAGNTTEPFLRPRGASFPTTLISCAPMRGHGSVRLYFVDAFGNRDDDYGRDFGFNK